jgi:DAK2 domain fusion protein YloV
LTQQITGALFKEMILSGAAAIDNHKGEINELNVFPVPDGDTGTNMSLTMGAGATALRDASPETIGKAAEITAGALLRGARGNSGVILSLLFRGIHRHLKDLETADAHDFASAISYGVDSAYKAVMKPAEGTILTVSRQSASAAVTKAEYVGDIETVLDHALLTGHEALANTINQNPVLKRAGVVDAGGKGYRYILEGMLKALRGEKVQPRADAGVTQVGADKADFAGFDTEEITFTYCTEFIVGRQTPKDPTLLRSFLDKRGDSIVVVDDDEMIKVHVHSNEPGVILTEALTYGPLITIKVENMREQHTGKVVESAAVAAAAPEAVPAAATPEPRRTAAAPEKEFGVVAVSVGEGMSTVFHDLGVDNIIVGGQTMNPSTEDILKQIEATPSEVVFVLPNNKNIIWAAEQCIPLTDKKVIVLPSKTMPQGISAMIALDTGATAEENTALMTAAIGRVHTVQITYAARDSVFDGKDIHAGDYLALLEDTLIATGHDTLELMDAVAASLAGYTPEFITIFTGADADEQTAAELQNRLTDAVPGAETTVVYGGQPVYYFLISAE